MFLWLSLLLLFTNIAFADNPPETIYDEGTRQGVAYRLNCVGSGIACTQSGITGTITVNGGGTAAGGTNAVQYNSGSSTFAGDETKFSLNPSGNVGIGTTNATKIFDVRGQENLKNSSNSVSSLQIYGYDNGGSATVNELDWFDIGTGNQLGALGGTGTGYSGAFWLLGDSLNASFGELSNFYTLDRQLQPGDARIAGFSMRTDNAGGFRTDFVIRDSGSSLSIKEGITGTGVIIGQNVDGVEPTKELEVVGTVKATAFSGDGSALTSVTATPAGAVPTLQYNSAGSLGGIAGSGADANGNIGIGSAGPRNKLVVVGNVGIGTQSYSTYITNTPKASGLVIEGNIGVGTWFNDNSGLSVMRGNVGIGTWVPATLMEVKGAAAVFKVSDTANGASMVQVQNNSNAMALSASTAMLYNINNGILAFGTNSGEKMRIDQNGNIGIGTIRSGGALVIMPAIGGGQNVGIGTWSSLQASLVIQGNVGIGTNKGSSFTGTQPPLGGMIVEGNVGIGSLSPGQPLDVAGNLRLATGGFLVSQQTTAPTVANNDCGTTSQGTITTNSSDLLGTLTVGTLAVTSCAMTFNKTHNTAPICFCQDDSNVLAVRCTTTTTKLTITSATSMSSDVVAYWCPTNLP